MRTYDVIVIGGGVIGVAVAYYLSNEGIKIALIERGDLASGSSSHCDASILVSGKKPGFDTKMAFYSHQLFKEFLDKNSYDFEYKQSGSMYVFENEKEKEIAKAYVQAQSKNGYPMQMLNQKEVHYEEPFLADDIIGGFLELNHDASINPMKYIYALSNEASRNKAHFFTFCPVKDVSYLKKNHEYLITTSKEKFLAKNVINCAGVWAPEIGKMVGIKIPIYPRQGQLLVSEKTIPICKRKITEFGYISTKYVNNSNKISTDNIYKKCGISFVIFPSLHLNYLVGSSRQFVGFDEKVSFYILHLIAKRAIRFLPILQEINIIRAYAGLRPFVPDNIPIISKVDELSGFYIAAGHEGSGLGNSLITGKLISQMITGCDTLLPIDKFSFNRFDGKLNNFNNLNLEENYDKK